MDMNAFASAIPRPFGKQISNVYEVPIPSVPDGTYRFQFNVRIGADNYLFYMWYNNRWYVAITFPSGHIRTAAILPNATQWTSYPDYGVYPFTTFDTINQNDLKNVSLYMVKWI